MSIYYLCLVSHKLFQTSHVVILYFTPHNSMCIKYMFKPLSKK